MCIILLLIVLNHLLSCLQWCMTGLGICTVHGFVFGVGFIVVALTSVITCIFFSTVGKKNKTTPCRNVSCFPLQEEGSPVEPRGRVSEEPQYQECWTAEQFRQTCRDCIQAIPARCVCVLALVERVRVTLVAWISSPPRLLCFPSRFPAWVLAERSGPADGAVVLFSPLRRPLISDIQGTEATPDARATLRYSVSPGWDCGRPRRGGSGECACRRSSTWMIKKRLP